MARMSKSMIVLGRVLAFAVPVGLGTLAVIYADRLRQPPAGADRAPQPTVVRVITLDPVPVVPRVAGYGTVTPVRDWRAIARIEGEVVATAPDLANGMITPAGTELLRLDDTDLRLTLAQIDAQIGALAVKDQTLAASLAIARADLDLSRQDLARQQELVAQGAATQAKLEATRRTELTARAKVTDVENQIALTAAERAVLAAQRAVADRALAFTVLRAPYDLRVGEVTAELGQVVTKGQVLMTGEGIDAVEVAAQFPIGRMGPVLRATGGTVTDLSARVLLVAPDHAVTWKARVDRVAESIDTRTQSTAIVVRVDDPLGQAEAGQRPPLRRNTFVQVVLMAPQQQALIAPMDAVRDGKALVVTDGILEPRQVQIAYVLGDVAVLGGGLSAGDMLVVTDPALAVPGMAVRPAEDKALKAQIAATALGQSGTGAGKGQRK